MRVTVVTAGHLAQCPRMLKAADAMHEHGVQVRVVSTCTSVWAAQADRELHARRGWRWDVVDYTRAGAPVRWAVTGLRARLARTLARGLSPGRSGVVTRTAFSRFHAELVSAILHEPGDLIYGGTTGALAAVAEASRRAGVPCGIDFEDFHCGEHEATRDGILHNTLAGVVMAEAAREATFVTAGSAAIADACETRFKRQIIPIHNVFVLPERPQLTRPGGPLRLYWFSQTIGAGRGLEEVVAAAGQADVECELHLRGVSAPGYVPILTRAAAAAAPRLRVVVHGLADPDAMVEAGRGFDVGICAEQGHIPNRTLALANKALTYPLVPLALVLTDTPGQRPLAADLGGHALVYVPGRIDVLAAGLAKWASNPADLQRAKAAAWDAARRRWHWHHPLERDALLAAVERTA